MTFVTMAMIFPTLALLALSGSGPKCGRLDGLRTAILLDRGNTSDSKAICRNKYTDLVTIYNNEDNEKMETLVEDERQTWFGLQKGNNTYKWSNGDPVIYNNIINNNFNVCAVIKAKGAWDTLMCNQNRSFICYSDEPGNSPVYHQINITKTWFNAQNYCRTNFTDLVSIRNDEQNKAVLKIKSNPNDSWIGLIIDSWEWSDGGLSGYRKWSEGVLINPLEAAFSIGGWKTMKPTNQNRYICYKAHIHISEESMTWERSLDYCQKYHGSLSIESPVEQKVVDAFMRRNSVTGPVWLGLQQSRLFGFWMWTKGKSVDWSNWEGGKKPKLPLSHPCGALRENLDLKTWAWTDMNCMSEMQTLCFDPSFPQCDETGD